MSVIQKSTHRSLSCFTFFAWRQLLASRFGSHNIVNFSPALGSGDLTWQTLIQGYWHDGKLIWPQQEVLIVSVVCRQNVFCCVSSFWLIQTGVSPIKNPISVRWACHHSRWPPPYLHFNFNRLPKQHSKRALCLRRRPSLYLYISCRTEWCRMWHGHGARTHIVTLIFYGRPGDYTTPDSDNQWAIYSFILYSTQAHNMSWVICISVIFISPRCRRTSSDTIVS